ncbi:MAG: heavy metal translocating P-type ATPase [Candidatus Brocadiaceae bacterium]|nr:heavy metal translocating P-type ATPase [Candidatus Brocadiaceae bacterium]
MTQKIFEDTVKLQNTNSNCSHCGIVIPHKSTVISGTNDTVFCCWGCETVYHIVHKQKFSLVNKPYPDSSGYDFLDNEAFLKDYLIQSHDKHGMRFFIEGIQCTSCLWIIEQIPDWIPQVESTHLNMSQKTLFVSLKEPGYFGKVVSTLAALGYRTYPIKNLEEAKVFHRRENHQQLMRLGVAAACTGNIMLVSFSLYSGLKDQMAMVFQYLNLAFFLPILFYCAHPFYRTFWRSLKTRRPSIDVPIIVAVIIGFGLSVLNLVRGNKDFYFDSLSVLVVLLLASRYFLNRTQQALAGSSHLQSFLKSQICQRWSNAIQAYEKVPASQLQEGDTVLIKKGDRIPADGIVTNEWVNINPSILTGESLPQKLLKGSRIFAGTQVISDSAEIVVKHTVGDSRIGEILKKVEEQVQTKTPFISFTDKAAQFFTIFVLTLGTVFFLFYAMIDPEEAVRRSLALIILACPCALAFAIPLTQSISLRKASKKGYLIKNAESLEKLGQVKNAFFDKTGTLTQGLFEFIGWRSPTRNGPNTFFPDHELLNAVYSIEIHSQHPVARSLVKHLEKGEIKRLPVRSLKEIPRAGISGMAGENTYKILSASLGEPDDGNSDIIASVVSIYKNGGIAAYACLGDTLRNDAKQTVLHLKHMGIKSHILSGDKKIPVAIVAKKLCLESEQTASNLFPEEKDNIIKRTPQSLMVGDGVNDALAMSSDAVSIAVQGSVESSLLAADIYLTKEGVFPVVDLILLSKHTLTVIKRNLAFSFAYNFTGGMAALFGYISPLTAAILMPVSSLAVLASSVFGTKFLRRFNK